VSISIFRPGSIIITAGKDVGQLVRVYNYLNTMFQKHFKTISYVDAHDNRDHFLLNEERKIMRKENLVYIKKSNVVVRDESVAKPETTTTTTNVVVKSNASKPNARKPKAKHISKPTVFNVSETPLLDLSSLKIAVKITTTNSKSSVDSNKK
jgi:hypothetical protein